jgi:hypothetical protein
MGVIVKNPEILGGAPVFRGTRVPIQALFDYLKGGETLEDFLEGSGDGGFPSPDDDMSYDDMSSETVSSRLDLVKALQAPAGHRSHRDTALRLTLASQTLRSPGESRVTGTRSAAESGCDLNGRREE